LANPPFSIREFGRWDVEGAAAEGRYVADRHRGEVDATLASIGAVVALDSTLIWHGNRLRHPLTLQSRAEQRTLPQSVGFIF
jgi:hypothetical protein